MDNYEIQGVIKYKSPQQVIVNMQQFVDIFVFMYQHI